MAERLPRGIRRLFRLGTVRRQVERDVDEELVFHFREAVDEGVRRGLTEAEALRRAVADFGDVVAHRGELRRLTARRARRRALATSLESLRGSVLGALRSARRHGVLTAGIIVTWALGFGLSTTMYGVVDRLLLRPPHHVVRPGELRHVMLERRESDRSQATRTESLSNYPDFAALSGLGAMEVAGYSPTFTMTVGRGVDAVRAPVVGVFPGFFHVLGIRPVLGRFLDAAETSPGEVQPVVISAERWRGAHGADPEVLGRQVEIGGRSHRVVGVAPAGFTGLGFQRVDYWVPLRVSLSRRELHSPLPLPGLELCVTSRRCRWMGVVARLVPGVAETAAESEATQRLTAARRADGGDDGRVRVRLTSISAASRGTVAPAEIRLSLWLVAFSVLVLFIATANVVSLLLARGVRERSDMVLRMVLGAGRRRIVAQEVGHALFLALVSAGLALGLTRFGGALIRSILLPDVYFPDGGLNPWVMAFAASTAVIFGLVASIAPAVAGMGGGFGALLSNASPSSSPARSRLLQVLTNAQVAMCVLLLVGAGLFVRSVDRVEDVDLGLEVDGLLLASLVFEDPTLPVRRANELYEEAARSIRGVSGVSSAALTNAPLGLVSTVEATVPGLESEPEWPDGGPIARHVSAGYFETTGVDIVRGRPLLADDPETVTVVDETMARHLWPESDALGACIHLYGSGVCTRVVGVAEPTATSGFRDGQAMAMYLPQDGDGAYQAIYVRAAPGVDPRRLAATIASTLDRAQPEILTSHVESVEALLDPQIRSWRIGAVLLSLFGGLALCLAMVGLFAVLAFDVLGRQREIGIRSALGASDLRLLGEVLARGALMTGIGWLAGISSAFLATPYIGGLLFDVSPRDPLVFGGVTLCLGVTAVVGSLIPGVRAMRTSPANTLRTD